MTNDQDLLNQTDLGRIRSELEKINTRIGAPTTNDEGDTVGGTGLVGDFHRFRIKAERRFGVYDKLAWVLTGVGGTVSVMAVAIWWLISSSQPVQGLRAGNPSVEAHANGH